MLQLFQNIKGKTSPILEPSTMNSVSKPQTGSFYYFFHNCPDFPIFSHGSYLLSLFPSA